MYTQSAQGSTGVSASLSNSGTAVEGYYRNGTTTTYTATLSNGYGFDGWYTAATGGTRVSRNLSYSETCNSNRTLYARAFAVSVQGETGVTASMSRGSDGYTFTFTATMASDQKYGFKGWYTNSSGTGTPSSTDLSYSVALSSAATYYAKVFTVSAQGETGVSAAVSRGSDGRTFTFNASLSSNYAIDGWYDGSTRKSRDVAYSTTLSDSASYTVKAFTVAYSGDSGITVSASRGTDGKTYTFTGTLASVTSTTASTFDKWTMNGTGQSETSLTLTKSIDANTTVSASTFTTTVAKDSGFSAASISRASNTSVTVTATLKDNYALDGWYNGNTRENRTLSYTKTISSSDTLTAKSFSVSWSGDSGISVSAERSSDGRSYTFTGTLSSVTSTTASVFAKWTLNGSTVSGVTTLTYTLTVDANAVVAASSYTITVAKGTGASNVSISRGSITSVTISTSMTTGYDFDGWYVNNVKKSSTAQTTLTTITASSTYTSVGVHHVYSLTAVGDAYSTGTITTQDYYYGTTATFTATITDNRYLFIGWYNDASFTDLYSSSAVTTYTITGDKTLYIKTRQKKRIFYKVNGTWQEIPVVYRKENGVWVVIEPDNYQNVFHTDVKYINRDNN